MKRCPDAVDVTDLQFKLSCRLKIFENIDISTFPNPCSLVSSASRFGLLFVGSYQKQFQVIQTKNIHTYSIKDVENIEEYPCRTVSIPSPPKHISTNCDSTILAVIVEKGQCPVVIFYEVLSFLKTTIKVIKEARLSATPNVHIQEINWNPSIPGIFTACKSDGTLGVYELKGDSIEINELPTASGATCFCWSPKGKQIAVGSVNGNITQYKPDLKPVKIIPEPKFQEPRSLISLQWVSNYQFIGIYQHKTEGSSLVVIDAPKVGEPCYTNYEDICYSGSSRPPQFHLLYQQNWNFLMVASANGTEVGVLGNVGDSWTQWIMPDSARAELPLSSDYQETLPIGLTLDISSTTPLPWGESTIPPCPMLCMLSHQGILCCFNVVYLKEGIPSVCTPPDSISDQSGLALFVSTSSPNNLNQITPVKQLDHMPASTVSIPFSFGAPIQSTPLTSDKPVSDSPGFGSRPSLTPIKANTIFGGEVLITPIDKANTEGSFIANTDKNLASNERYSSIFSALNSTVSQAATPVKPVVITAPTKIETPDNLQIQVSTENVSLQRPFMENTSLQRPVSESTSLQLSTGITMKKESEKNESVDPATKAETAAMLCQLITDEWNILEMELLVLLKQCRLVKINIGTDQEKIKMIEQIEDLQSFIKEAIDISVGQSSEIHCLKQNLIQSWAWFEEARSHYNSSKNETISLLLKLQPLDSVAEKKLKDIQQIIYYIESQLVQACKTLDEQWDNFQNYAKKKFRVQMPTMETIFQTMVRQSAILQKQTYLLKDISMRLRKKTGTSSLLLSLDKTNELADDLKDLHLSTSDIVNIQYEKIRHHTKSLTSEKINKLRTLLKQRTITKVTAVKPQSSWSLNQLSSNKIRHSISTLGAHMSPVSKASVVRNLEFTQSTPQKEIEPIKLITPDSKPLPVEPVKSNFTSSTNSLSATPGFISLAKTGSNISSTQGSAFVPTGSMPMLVTAVTKDQQVISKSTSGTLPFGINKILSATSGLSTSNSESSSTFVIKPPINSAALKSQPLSTGGATTSNATFSFGVNTCNAKLVGSNSSIFSSFPSNQTSQGMKTTNSLNLVKPIQTPACTTSVANVFGSSTFSFNASNLVKTSESTKESNPTESKPRDAVKTINTAISTGGNTGLIFSPTNKTDASSLSTQASLFNTNTKNAPVSSFTPSTQPAFGISTSGPALFGNTSGLTSIPFKVTTTASSSSLFGNINISQKTTHPFGTAATVNSSTPFGSSTVTPSSSSIGSSSSLFKNTSVISTSSSTVEIGTSVTSSSLFGHTVASPTASSSISATPSPFGSTTTAPISLSSFAISTTTSSASVFGNTAVSPPVSSFNTVVTATTPSSPFGNSTSSTSFGTAKTTANTSLFGSNITTTATPSSLLAGTTTSVLSSATATTTSPLFGRALPFGNVTPSPTTPLFGSATTTQSSSFGNVITTANSSTPFATKATTASSAALFGNPPNSAFPSLFGNSTSKSISSETPSIFGSPSVTTNVTTTASSIFGNTTQSTKSESATIVTSGLPIFGKDATTVSNVNSGVTNSKSTSNIFGGTASNLSIPSTTSSNSIFGQSVPTIFPAQTNTSSNIFNTKTTNNVFGQATTSAANVFAATTASNVFSSAATSANIFGSPSTPTTFGNQNSSIFATNKTSGNAFGQTTVFGNASNSTPSTTTSSIFGQPSAFGTTSVFGTTTTTTSGNIFGSSSASNNNFGTGFGSISNSATTFPASTAPTGTFGFSSLNVGSPSGSIFGGSGNGFGQTSAENPFGKAEAKSTFGSSSASLFGSTAPNTGTTNVFGSPTTSTSSGFGSSFNTPGGGFGSQNTFGSSPFGQKSTFGQSPSFGNFGTPQNTGSFNTSATSSVAQSGFGSPNTFQKPGFGNAPVFGGSPAPAFGAAPSFGSSPVFGSAPAFGSPEKVFGSTQSAAAFGSMAVQQNTGFANIASQNTIGFGNLAQQAKTPSNMQFSGGASFSNWR